MIRLLVNFRSLCLVVLVFLALPTLGLAGILDVDQNSNEIDLAKYREPIAAERASINVQGPTDPTPATLKGQGPGPTYYWSLFSFHNTTDHDLDFSLVLTPQRFAGSGLLVVKSAGQSALGAVLTRSSTAAKFDVDGNVKSLDFHVVSKETLNIAVEGIDANLNATLMQKLNWQKTRNDFSFFRGLLLGIALIVVLGILACFAFRPHRATLAGWLFSLAAILFIVFDAGFAASLIDGFGVSPGFVRVVVESLMTASLAFCAIAFLAIDPKRSMLGMVLLAVPFLALANLAYGQVEPNLATAAARIGFVAVAVIGAVRSFWQRGKNNNLIDPTLVFWAPLFVWIVFAGLIAAVSNRTEVLSPFLEASLAAVLVALAVVLLRNMLTQGLVAKPFITDASRRSLALTSAGHILWEWQPAKASLGIGDELAGDLGYPEKPWGHHARQMFRDLVHPLDLPSYEKMAERTDFHAGDIVEMELRLKDVEGGYHWYGLQARALPGHNKSIDRCIGTLTDISKLKQAEERMSVDALEDVVTGLPNKALLLERLSRGTGKAGVLPMRIVVVDLDRFKIINDGLGQEQGDKILKIIGNRLHELVDDDETVARLSGGQFAILCSERIDRGDFSEFTKSLQETVSNPVKLGAQHIVLTASIGVSSASSSDHKAQDLIDQANVAMLEARGDGGGQAVVYHGDMKDDRARLMSLEIDLRRALAQNEIEVYFQPIVVLASLEIAGFEALARWRHPELGLLSPSEFIEIAESTGMIAEIGQFILANAARQLGIWQRVLMRGRPFFVSVNVSAVQLMAQDLPRQVKAILDRETLAHGSLKIEITETVIMRQPERAAKVLQQLQALGVGLACDDFGTGFSSLASLRDFPFDTLKIDRSFIAPQNFDERNGKIITSITTLARSLGMGVVAEGIETQEQIDRLAALGCELGQGYLLGAPETALAASERLALMKQLGTVPTPEPRRAEQASSLYVSMPSFSPTETDYADIFETQTPEELPSIFLVPAKDKRPKPIRKVVAKKTKPKKRR
jgi:diguanylate cyclase (GGDEF)-like protein